MTRFALILALLVCAPTAVQACVILGLDKFSGQDWRDAAADVVKKAAVIVDGEVTRPQGNTTTFAVIRAHKVLKGPRRKAFLVDAGPSCDVPMTELGQRGRFVLSGGP